MKNKKTTINIFICFVLSFLTLSCFASTSDYMIAKHHDAAQRWLDKNKDYRFATIEDCECLDGVMSLRRGDGKAWKPQPEYQPYYSVSDFNGDGFIDFAVVVRPVAKEEGALVLTFLAIADGRFVTPLVYQIREKSISNLGLFLGRSKAKEKPMKLLIGAFFSEGEVIPMPKEKKPVK